MLVSLVSQRTRATQGTPERSRRGIGGGFFSQLLIWSQQTGWEEMGNSEEEVRAADLVSAGLRGRVAKERLYPTTARTVQAGGGDYHR